LTPRSAWQADGKRLKVPLPTVVHNPGGPSMVFNGSFTGGYNRIMLPLAVRGYAILFPNCRIRGGYGPALERSESFFRLPHEDVMAGVDRLVELGIADPERLGAYGHSYGAMLTAYTITQTDRFNAVVLHESVGGLGRMPGNPRLPGSFLEMLQRERYGVPDILDPAYRERIISEIPLFHFSRVATPTMLQYGATGGGQAQDSGVHIFAALERLRVPNEFVLYNEGHTTVRPAAITDEIVRTAEWFDYWLRGLAYPDAARARAYDEWRSAKASRRKTLQPN
jgi:dipeptidyl aminopeptidase/acylaminoacyl peptidase